MPKESIKLLSPTDSNRLLSVISCDCLQPLFLLTSSYSEKETRCQCRVRQSSNYNLLQLKMEFLNPDSQVKWPSSHSNKLRYIQRYLWITRDHHMSYILALDLSLSAVFKHFNRLSSYIEIIV